jgi:hypothetical protein
MATDRHSFFRGLLFAAVVLIAGVSGSVFLAQGGARAQSADDTETEGQVVAINSLAPRAMVRIGNVDGTVTLYFKDATALASSTVRFGDYISIVGRKLNELEYEVETLRVDARAATNHASSSGTGYGVDDYGDDYTDDGYSDEGYDDEYPYDDGYVDEEPTPTATLRRTRATR